MDDGKSSLAVSPERAARELLPLLRRPDESLDSIRALIMVRPSDEACMRLRGVDESTIVEASNYRTAILVEFDRLIERRGIK